MSTISVDYDVLNQRGSPAWFTDTFANIPTAGYVGRMFISKDTFAFYRDTGTGWDLIGGPGIGTLTGSGVVGQVSFFNGTQVLAGNNNLFWDNTNSRLGINTTTPGQPLDIHSTGNTLVQLNNTTTANSNISFQNQNVAKWRVGNVYNAGANSFNIENAVLLTNALTISSTTNNITLTGGLTATGVIANNFYGVGNGVQGGYIYLKQGTTPYAGLLGSNGISADGTKFLLIANVDASNNKIALFELGSLTNNTNRTYTLPDTTGTLALTSDLSSYLPLAGGTLTGNLTINPTNTGVVGLDVASNTTRFRSDNLEGFKRQLEIVMGSGTLVQLTAKGYLANYGTDMAFYTATTGGTNASPGIYITGTNNRVGIKTGTPAYDLDVTGTFGVSGAGIFSAFLGVNGSPATAFPLEAYINSSTAYTTSSRGNILRVFNSNTTANIYAGIELGGAGTSNDGLAGLNAVVTASGSAALTFYTRDSNTFAERMRITSGGNVGVGISGVYSDVRFMTRGASATASDYSFRAENSTGGNLIFARNDGLINLGLQANSPYNLTNTGRTMIVSSNGEIGYLVSTRESKANIENIKNIDFINQLNPVQFNYRKKDNNLKYTDELYDNITYGFIADEVEKVNKELVFYNEDNTLAGVEYNSIIAILTKAIQELNEKLVRNNIN